MLNNRRMGTVFEVREPAQIVRKLFDISTEARMTRGSLAPMRPKVNLPEQAAPLSNPQYRPASKDYHKAQKTRSSLSTDPCTGHRLEYRMPHVSDESDGRPKAQIRSKGSHGIGDCTMHNHGVEVTHIHLVVYEDLQCRQNLWLKQRQPNHFPEKCCEVAG